MQLIIIVIDNRFIIMSTPETLAQLICRTVLEFEQRQASQLPQEKRLEKTIISSDINTSNQATSKREIA